MIRVLIIVQTKTEARWSHDIFIITRITSLKLDFCPLSNFYTSVKTPIHTTGFVYARVRQAPHVYQTDLRITVLSESLMMERPSVHENTLDTVVIGRLIYSLYYFQSLCPTSKAGLVSLLSTMKLNSASDHSPNIVSPQDQNNLSYKTEDGLSSPRKARGCL